MLPPIGRTSPKPFPMPPVKPFSDFVPTSIKQYRDGGTVEMEGLINGGRHPATVRLDYHFRSPTHGQLFVKSGGAGERVLDRTELEGLLSAIGTRTDNPLYGVVADAIRKQLGC